MTDENTMKDTKQPRFSVDVDADEFFYSTLKWYKENIKGMDAPDYVPDSRKRDSWLLEFPKLEPHLAGVLLGATSIDANRGWSVTGGRNQAIRFSNALHNWTVFRDLIGWRMGFGAFAHNYYNTDLGGAVELGRAFEGGPLRGLFHLDSTRCALTGDIDYPLKYKPQKGKLQKWKASDYLRVTSQVNTDEKFNGLGWCAVSRCIELAQIMIAIYLHDKESLGAQAPRGLLLLQGISEKQFKSSMAGRSAELEGRNWQYYDAISVLASGDRTIDGKLIALSNLPRDFDREVFTSLLMYGYALAFGYDASEFYPVKYGGLGRSAESDIQHVKASGKGAKNLTLAFADGIMRPDIAPSTVLFAFDDRDDDSELSAAAVTQAWANAFKAIRETALSSDGLGGITREEYRILLAEKNIIDPEWTLEEEPLIVEDEEGHTDASEANELPDETTTDEDAIARARVAIATHKRSQAAIRRRRDRLLSNPRIMAAAVEFPDQEIVRYQQPARKLEILWESGADLLQRRSYAVPAYVVQRQANDEVLYEGEDFDITDADVTRSIATAARQTPEFAQLLDPPAWEEADE